MDFAQAIVDFDAIVDCNEDTVTALFAELNLLYAKWKSSKNKSNLAPSGTGSMNFIGDTEYLHKRKNLLSQLLKYTSDDDDDDPETIPEKFEFSLGNYPNPFNPETIIRFSIPEDSNVKLEIFNIRGQRVRTLVNENLMRGNHQAVWNGIDENGRSVGSGIYMYRLQSEKQTMTRRMVLLK